MLAVLLLYGLLLVATFTDLRWGVIFNWTTYPGILAALGLSGLASVWTSAVEVSAWPARISQTPFADAVLGFLACAVAMLVCYVFFPGGVGGGDLKLVAMIGAFLGLRPGLEAMLWTMILGGCLGLIVLVWQVGAWRLIRRSGKYLLWTLRLRALAPLSDEDRQPLRTRLPLSAAALVAVLIVQFDLVDWF